MGVWMVRGRDGSAGWWGAGRGEQDGEGKRWEFGWRGEEMGVWMVRDRDDLGKPWSLSWRFKEQRELVLLGNYEGKDKGDSVGRQCTEGIQQGPQSVVWGLCESWRSCKSKCCNSFIRALPRQYLPFLSLFPNLQCLPFPQSSMMAMIPWYHTRLITEPDKEQSWLLLRPALKNFEKQS